MYSQYLVDFVCMVMHYEFYYVNVTSSYDSEGQDNPFLAGKQEDQAADVEGIENPVNEKDKANRQNSFKKTNLNKKNDPVAKEKK